MKKLLLKKFYFQSFKNSFYPNKEFSTKSLQIKLNPSMKFPMHTSQIKCV